LAEETAGIDQRYCSVSACRAASRAASQARWLAAPENQDYFRGSVNVARVIELRIPMIADSDSN